MLWILTIQCVDNIGPSLEDYILDCLLIVTLRNLAISKDINCVRAQSRVGHAAAVATTAKSLHITLIVVVPPSLSPSEIDSYSYHQLVCNIHCHGGMNGTPSGARVPRGPRHHYGTHRSTTRRLWNGRTESQIRPDTEGADKRRTVLTAHPGSTDGLQPSTTNHRPAAADHRPTDKAVPAPSLKIIPSWSSGYQL